MTHPAPIEATSQTPDPFLLLTEMKLTDLPRIGQAWPGQGGVFAGLVRGAGGAPDYLLILGPEYDGELTGRRPWTGRRVSRLMDTLIFLCQRASSNPCSSGTSGINSSANGIGPVSSTPSAPPLPGCSTSATAARTMSPKTMSGARAPSAD